MIIGLLICIWLRPQMPDIRDCRPETHREAQRPPSPGVYYTEVDGWGIRIQGGVVTRERLAP